MSRLNLEKFHRSVELLVYELSRLNLEKLLIEVKALNINVFFSISPICTPWRYGFLVCHIFFSNQRRLVWRLLSIIARLGRNFDKKSLLLFNSIWFISENDQGGSREFSIGVAFLILWGAKGGGGFFTFKFYCIFITKYF